MHCSEVQSAVQCSPQCSAAECTEVQERDYEGAVEGGAGERSRAPRTFPPLIFYDPVCERSPSNTGPPVQSLVDYLNIHWIVM